jgi:DNA-binding transcriptional regulator YiaG
VQGRPWAGVALTIRPGHEVCLWALHSAVSVTAWSPWPAARRSAGATYGVRFRMARTSFPCPAPGGLTTAPGHFLFLVILYSFPLVLSRATLYTETMSEHDLERISAIGKEIAAARDDAVRRMAGLRSERAEVVRRLRAAGWSLGDLAARYGVSRTRVQQWEAGNGDT